MHMFLCIHVCVLVKKTNERQKNCGLCEAIFHCHGPVVVHVQLDNHFYTRTSC